MARKAVSSSLTALLNVVKTRAAVDAELRISRPGLTMGIGLRGLHSACFEKRKQWKEVPNYKETTGSELRRSYTMGTNSYPPVSDPDVKAAFKKLMASGWDDISNDIINDAKKALSKSTNDKAGQGALANVVRAAEASSEFTAILVNIRMALEERTGLTGESVSELPASLLDAVSLAYKRYVKYICSFGPEETYLRKKVEAELGTRLIHLKQRLSGLGSEWGEINVIGTSGLSGSYVEQRAP